MTIQTASEVREWARRCRFDNRAAAFALFDTPIRTWYRWLDHGLPTGAQGRMIEHCMEEIERRRTRKRK